jgi:hypothetical protein
MANGTSPPTPLDIATGPDQGSPSAGFPPPTTPRKRKPTDDWDEWLRTHPADRADTTAPPAPPATPASYPGADIGEGDIAAGRQAAALDPSVQPPPHPLNLAVLPTPGDIRPPAPLRGLPPWKLQPPAQLQGTKFGPASTIVSWQESRNRNVREEIKGRGPVGPASGFLQIEDDTWREFAPQVGVNVNQYPTAMEAPPQVQSAVAARIPLRRWARGTVDAVLQAFPWATPNMTLGQIDLRAARLPRQRYILANENRPHTEWGRPPALSDQMAGPGLIPTRYDIPVIMDRGRRMQPWLSQNVGFPNMLMLQAWGGYQTSMQNGQMLGAIQQQQNWKQNLADSRDRMEVEAMDMSSAFAAYGPDALGDFDQQALTAAMMQIAGKYNDGVLRDIAGDPAAIERLMHERDKYFTDISKTQFAQEKADSEQKKLDTQLQIEQEKLQQLKKHGKQVEEGISPYVEPEPGEEGEGGEGGEGGAAPSPYTEPSGAAAPGPTGAPAPAPGTTPPPGRQAAAAPPGAPQTAQAPGAAGGPPEQQVAEEPPPPTDADTETPDRTVEQTAGPPLAGPAPGGSSEGTPQTAAAGPAAAAAPGGQPPAPPPSYSLKPRADLVPGVKMPRLSPLGWQLSRQWLEGSTNLAGIPKEAQPFIRQGSTYLQAAAADVLRRAQAGQLKGPDVVGALKGVDLGLGSDLQNIIDYNRKVPSGGGFGAQTAAFWSSLSDLAPYARPGWNPSNFDNIDRFGAPNGRTQQTLGRTNTMAEAAVAIMEDLNRLKGLPSDVFGRAIEGYKSKNVLGDYRFTSLIQNWLTLTQESTYLKHGGPSEAAVAAQADILASPEQGQTALPWDFLKASIPGTPEQFRQAVVDDLRTAFARIRSNQNLWTQLGKRTNGQPDPMPGYQPEADHQIAALIKLNPVTGKIAGDVPPGLEGIVESADIIQDRSGQRFKYKGKGSRDDVNNYTKVQ